MKKIHWWFSILAFLFGLLLMVVSINTSVTTAYPSAAFQASQRQFYLSSTILPDHVFYPVLMLADKIQLQSTVFPKKLWLEVEYGWRRLDYTRQLLAKNKPELALSTFTKSQKYFLKATQQVLNQQASQDIKDAETNEINAAKNGAKTATVIDDVNTDAGLRLQMLKHLTAYLWEAKIVVANFDGAQKAIADQLIGECEVAKLRLSQSLSL